ncbi:hypothetical protein OSB04_022225 [Centaurea solstitialis]|uniref:Pentatricopeptide repeat-containing protein n=1 Tax=Centaurea solstitialis TaxID=347529 RepID=A0AA38W5Q4_9ASTR|nr:hypothetical protein OSB04_022225 [Centaurea solstitialis]
MFIFLRSLVIMGRTKTRYPNHNHRVSLLLSSSKSSINSPNNIFLYNCSSPSPSQSSSFTFLFCVTGFFCFFRYPFSSRASNCDEFGHGIDSETVCEIVRNERWDDYRIRRLIGSGLAPIWVSNILVQLKEEPLLALKLFKWAETTSPKFCHTSESYCILAHILFFHKLYNDSHGILRDLISSSGLVSPGFDVFDVMWATRNVCRFGWGVFDTLFNVLVELERFEEANDCFLKMKTCRVLPKARSCNSLLSRSTKMGKGEFSKKFFKEMVTAGIKPSVFTYNIMIDYLSKEGDVKGARTLFAEMKVLGITPDIVTYNSLIDGHGKLGQLAESICIYDDMKNAGCNPDVITYNALINCFCKFGKMPQAFEFLHYMKKSGLKPNVVTYSTFIDAFCKEGMMQEAIKFFMDMRRVGLFPNEFTYTSLVDANCKAGRIGEAVKLIKEMSEAGIAVNTVTCTALLDGLSKEGKMKEAEEFLGEMLKTGISPNVKSYTTLLHGYIKSKSVTRAMDVWEQMEAKNYKPDLLLYGTLILRLCNDKKLEDAKVVFEEMKKSGTDANFVIYTTIMDAYFKSGQPTEALNLLQEMNDVGMSPSVVTYSALIDGLCKLGHVQEALDHFRKMPGVGLEPNVVVYTALIDGLCKNDGLELGLKLFDEMLEKGVIPDITAYTVWLMPDSRAYTSLICGLCRCGRILEARIFFDEMITNGVHPDDVVYGCLLKKYYELAMGFIYLVMAYVYTERGALNLIDYSRGVWGEQGQRVWWALGYEEMRKTEMKMTLVLVVGRHLESSVSKLSCDGEEEERSSETQWELACGLEGGTDISNRLGNPEAHPQPQMNREMGARVPVQQYNLRSADPYIDGSCLHDLNNTVDGRVVVGRWEIIEPMVDRDAVTDESLENEDDSVLFFSCLITASGEGAFSPYKWLLYIMQECMHESYQNTLPLHSVGVEGGHSSLDTNGSSRDTYNILSADDVSPIETARARFLDFIVDNFIISHVVEVTDSETMLYLNPWKKSLAREKQETSNTKAIHTLNCR